MFQIKDGKITLNKTKVLTPKQLATISQINSEHERNQYLMSLIGLTKVKCRIPRIKTRGYDNLHDKPKSSILKQMQRLQNLERDHKPNENGLGQWVGVEVECIIPHQDGTGDNECNCEFDDDNGALTYECKWCANGQADNWSEEQAHRWLKSQLLNAGVTRCCVKEDRSLEDDDGHGVEVTILFNSTYGFEQLHKLCNALSKAGCYVNETCGLHVHLDARHLTVKATERVGATLGHALPILKYLVPKDRQTNAYCALGVSKLIKACRQDGTYEERYYAINLTSYPRYKTIEVRLHGGTIDSKAIESWVTLLKLIGGSKLTTSLSTFQDLIDLGLSEPMIEYAERLVSEYNPEAWPLLTQGTDTIFVQIINVHRQGA